jgi:hypothetical protein
MRLWEIIVATTVGAGSSVAADVPSPADMQFFESKVRPVLVERCHGCHSLQAKKQKGGLLLDSRQALLKGGDTGPALVSGEPMKSLLIEAVRYDKNHLQMPPKGKLPAHEIEALTEWVKRGAIYPGSAATAVKPEGIDLSAGRKFWSFQAPKLAALPAVRDPAWPQRRIDNFLLAELEKRHLAPSRPAERRVLIRRATYDLTGLPPTPAEVEAFLADARPEAYERLVERLLASPQYGERWGRFWLDLARYCDVAEAWAENQGQSWLYRDWVVQAFNADLPYDRFVQQQLAADLLPGAAPQDRAALGFLGLSPNYWKELQLDKEVIKGVVADEWEERIDALSSTFLGLTVACARCHDHKFDPIRAHDYYALAGVLASTRQADLFLLPEPDAARVQAAHARVRSLQEQIKKLSGDKAEKPDKAQRLAELNAQVEQLKRETPNYDSPQARGVADASLHVLADGPNRTRLEYKPGVAQDVALQVRGNPSNLGAVVPRGFLTVFGGASPRTFTQGSGRLELAQAIVTDGAPLSARVIVNRVWKHHFGSGLVETPSDFGAQGARPSHPQLLDDLTARFIQHGWSLKWLHREIMASATYQQASAHDARQHAFDPDNRWLWRMNRRRLEVEAWRDAMLAVSGTLRLERGGPPVDLKDAGNQRRTLYGIVKRRELHDLLRLHDFPDPVAHSAGRIPTTTALQQLFTLNGPLLQQQAGALVKRLRAEVPADDSARIRRAYLLLYGRPATPKQTELALAFLSTGQPGTPASETLWTQYAQVLLGSNEFLFVD